MVERMSTHLPTAVPPGVAEVIRRYAATMCDSWDGSHQVCSPLGVWLLLAVLAGHEGDEDLEQALGVDAGRASRTVDDLQAVVARFTDSGFQAAATTTFGIVAASSWPVHEVRCRRGTLRLAHPDAGVAPG